MFIVKVKNSQMLPIDLHSPHLPSLEAAHDWRTEAVQILVAKGWRRLANFDPAPVPQALSVQYPHDGCTLTFEIIEDNRTVTTLAELLPSIQRWWLR